MKHHHQPQDHTHDPAPSRPQPAATLQRGETAYSPSPDEVARKAYFTYVNQGAPEGRSVQHWLDAEAELIAERNRTRGHGYHNPT